MLEQEDWAAKARRVASAEARRAKSSHWRALQVRPAAEFKVVETLMERHGVHAFVPSEVVWRGVGRRKVAVHRPLFRGYVFGQLVDDVAHLVHAVDGATRLYAMGGKPVRIDPVFVEKFMRAEAAGVFDKTLPPKARRKLEQGEQVELLSGPFGGFIASVVRLNGQRRVTVLVSIFGRMAEVDVDATDVVRTTDRAA